MEKEISLSLPTPFSGSYELLEFIIIKYNLSSGQVSEFASANSLNRESLRWNWRTYGVPLRIWNLIYKDLTIINLATGPEEFVELTDLKNEFNKINGSIS